MKIGAILGIIAAIVLHGGFLLFGGIFFNHDDQAKGKVQQVDLVSEAEAEKEKDKPKDEPEAEDQKDLETEAEEAPDAAEIIRQLQSTPGDPAPALEAMSLSALSQALEGGGAAGGDFADGMSLASGGRIGGTGKPGSLEEKIDSAFNMAEIDQKPRAVFQAAPVYPSELRGKKVEATVTLIFVVDAAGKVTNPRVERSTNPVFEKPALDALRQWKFEPAFKGGQRVGCRMRVPIRFQPQ